MLQLEQIIDRGGGRSKLAKKLNISRMAVWKWDRKGRVPAERVLAVAEITGYAPEQIRPDIYPPKTDAAE